MEKVKILDKTFRTYIPYDEIEASIDKLMEKVNSDFSDNDTVPVLLCVMNGSIMFTAEVMKRAAFDCVVSSIKVSSYEGTESKGHITVKQDLSTDITGKTVIIVEDIVDSGTTIFALTEYLKEKGAADVKICTLFYKPEAYRYKEELPIDYVAREIQNQFIVGFGLDYNELGRNYKDVYILDK